MPKHMAVNPVALQPMPSGPEDVNSTVLALRTLGSFDFQGQHLILNLITFLPK